MNIILNIIIFIFGAVMGSAANALIDRLPRKESWFKGRSKCDICGHKLEWKDLVPVFSYLSLVGKCRYCHSPIQLRNLLVELFMGGCFVLLGVNNVLLMGILWVTMIIAVMDWETRLVSEAIIVIWGLLVVGYSLLIGNFGYANIEGLLVGVGVIGGIWLVSHGRAMGEGDIEIAAVLGWWLGWEKTIITLWLAFILGAAIGLWQIARGKAGMKSEIAFGPFLVIGSWTAFILGDYIWRYLGFR